MLLTGRFPLFGPLILCSHSINKMAFLNCICLFFLHLFSASLRTCTPHVGLFWIFCWAHHHFILQLVLLCSCSTFSSWNSAVHGPIRVGDRDKQVHSIDQKEPLQASISWLEITAFWENPQSLAKYNSYPKLNPISIQLNFGGRVPRTFPWSRQIIKLWKLNWTLRLPITKGSISTVFTAFLPQQTRTTKGGVPGSQSLATTTTSHGFQPSGPAKSLWIFTYWLPLELLFLNNIIFSEDFFYILYHSKKSIS